jgi:hypothetical protein
MQATRGRTGLLWTAMLVVGAGLSLVAAEVVARQVFHQAPPIEIGKGDTKLSDAQQAAGFEGDPEPDVAPTAKRPLAG